MELLPVLLYKLAFSFLYFFLVIFLENLAYALDVYVLLKDLIICLEAQIGFVRFEELHKVLKVLLYFCWIAFNYLERILNRLPEISCYRFMI